MIELDRSWRERYWRVMRGIVLLLLLGISGCSNAPLAGTLDAIAPSHPNKNQDHSPPSQNFLPPVLDEGRPPQRGDF